MSDNNITYSLGRVGLNIRGVYDSAATYDELDVVTFEGSSYVAKDENTNVPPTDTDLWALLSRGNPINTITYADVLPPVAEGIEGQIVFVPST